MSELVVLTFDHEGTAEQALDSIRGIETANRIGLSDTAVIVKNAVGEVRVKNELSTGAEAGAIAGGVLGLVSSFLFPVVGTVAGAALGGLLGSHFHTGVDKKFVKDVSESLAAGSSALFLLIKHGEPAAVIAALEPFNGTVYQTTLPAELEESLRQALAT